MQPKSKNRLLIISIILIPIVAVIIWLLSTQSGLLFIVNQTKPYLSEDISYNKIEGTLFGKIKISDLVYNDNETQIKVEYITIDWSAINLLFSQLDINSLHVKSLTITLENSSPASIDKLVSDSYSDTLPEINLPFDINLNSILIDDFNLIQDQQQYNVNQLKVNANLINSKFEIHSLEIINEELEIKITALIDTDKNYSHTINLEWSANLKSTTTASDLIVFGKGTIIGDQSKLNIKQLINDTINLNVSVQLDNLMSDLNWKTNINISNFDLSKLNKTSNQWPAIKGKLNLQAKGNLNTATLTGDSNLVHPKLGAYNSTFSLQAIDTNHIQIEEFTVRSNANDSKLTIRGDWLASESNYGDIALALHWRNLQWPLIDEPLFNSKIGNGWIKGNMEQLNVELATTQPFPYAPDYTIFVSLKAAASDNGVTIDSLHLSELGDNKNKISGVIEANGNISWKPELTWQARVNAHNINPGRLSKEWPGKIKFSISNKGKIKNNNIYVDSKIIKIDGTLRGYPISGQGAILWQPAGIDIKELEFYSGLSSIKIQGQLNSSYDLKWNISSKNIAELYPNTKGSFYSTGKLNGNAKIPMINTNIKGKDLKFLDYKVSNINANFALDLFNWQKMNIRLDADDLNYKEYSIKSLNIKANNSELNATASSPSLTANLKLVGQSNSSGWIGTIQQANIISEQFSDWNLVSATKLDVHDNVLEIEPICLQQQQSKICVNLQHKLDVWHAGLELHKMPLKLLNPLFRNEIQLDGSVNLSSKLQYQESEKLYADAQITLPAGTIHFPLVESMKNGLQYQIASAKITLNKDGFVANSNFYLQNGDNLQSNLKLPNVDILTLDYDTQALDAKVNFNISKPKIFETFIPEIQDLLGKVTGDLSIQGTLANPKIEGNAKWKNGEFKVPQLGVTVKNINFSTHNINSKKLSYQLTGHSGKGNFKITGNTLLDQQSYWPTTIYLTGKDVEIADIPVANILISPELELTSKNKTVKITGKIHVPYAKIQPKDLSTASQISSDVVIGEQNTTNENKWSLSSRIKVKLGEMVRFRGFGFEGRLGGNLQLLNDPNKVTRAIGEITVNSGRYRAYGQKLDVENGKILFTGGPLSNPGLNLRAIRKTGDITTGLKIRGSLNKPKIDIFSIPAMDETEALSYLVLGRPLEDSSNTEGSMISKAALLLSLSSGDTIARSVGDTFGFDEMRVESSDGGEKASLVIGRYITPELYVSYGVGFLDSINIFKIRYQISDNWQMVGENGEAQSADLLYTIEK